MKWYLYLASYYGYKTKRQGLEGLAKAQKLVDKGQLLKAELIKE